MRPARILSLIASLLCCSVLVVAAEPPRFGVPVDSESIRFIQVLSPDGRVSSVLFENLLVHREGRTESLAPASARTFNYQIPLKLPEGCRPVVNQDIRGFVNQSSGGRASLVVDAGGQTRVVDLRAAIVEASKEDPSKKPERLKSLRKNSGDEFLYRLTVPASDDQTLGMTMLLVADSPSEQLAAVAGLQVDSVDSVMQLVPGCESH
jgi:hypothetical protein